MTLENPFWVVNQDWVTTENLHVGDLVQSLDKQPIVIVRIESDAERHTTYHFEVEDYHTYFVGDDGVWVHNMCDGVTTNGLTLGKVKDYLSNVKDVPRDKLVKDLQSIGLKIKRQSPDGRFVEFVDKSENVRAKIHPADKVTKNNHLHLLDKKGNALNSSL